MGPGLRGCLRLAACSLLASVIAPLPIHAEEPPKSGVYRATTDRVPMKFAFYSPTGRVGSVALSEVIRWVDTAVEENTDLDVTELDDPIVDRCAESSAKRHRLTCLVEESSEPWMTMRKSLPSTYSEVKHELRGKRNQPRYLLIISAAAAEGGDRLAAFLIDVEDALEHVYRRRSRSSQPTSDELDEVEDEISRFSVIARPPIVEHVESSEQLRAYVQALIESHLREAFEQAGRWRPFGSIEIDVDAAVPFAVELDGVSLGTTIAGKAKILDVHPGERQISLRSEDFEEYTGKVVVETGQTARLRATPIKKPSNVSFVLKQTVFWGGVASAAAGVGLMIYAAVARSTLDREDICVGGSGACSGPFLRFGAISADPAVGANGKGPPILPLGYSLAGLGAAWIVGPLIEPDDDRIPWIEAAVGAAVFAAAFGISLAADRSDLVCEAHGCP